MPEVLYLLGQAYGRTSNSANQIQRLEQLAKSCPSASWTADGLMQLAATYAKEGNRPGVLSSLLRFQNTFPDQKMQKDYAIWLADALVQAGSYETALVTIQGLSKEPLPEEEQESLLYLGALCNERCARFDQARKEYRAILTRFPKGSTILRSHLGAARSAKALGDVEEASHEVMVGFEILHGGAEEQPSIEAQFYLLQGDLEFGAGRFDLAYRAYARTSILYRHPEYTPRALLRSALCKEKLGDAQAAASLREQLKQEYPEYHEEGSGL
jgi:TolA-binding protein